MSRFSQSIYVSSVDLLFNQPNVLFVDKVNSKVLFTKPPVKLISDALRLTLSKHLENKNFSIKNKEPLCFKGVDKV